MNVETIYNSVPAVNELNRVEGFDPLNFIREINDNGKIQYYLDVKFRKLWFRLKYPNGKIKKKIVKLNEQIAIIESYIYLDKNDAEDNYIASALAQRSALAVDKYSDKYVELAETASVGRALADAGFGIQFCEKGEANDENVVDAPIEYNPETGEVLNVSVQNNITPHKENIVKAKETINPVKAEPKELLPTMSCEELLKIMTVNDAKKVIVNIGNYKGRTLAEVAVNCPKDLTWYADSYRGKNNLLRAGAKKLLESAM